MKSVNNVVSAFAFKWWDIIPYLALYDVRRSLKEQFTDEFEGGKPYWTRQTLLPNLLVELGVYKSTSEAMRAGFKGAIPSGEYIYFKTPGIKYMKRIYCFIEKSTPVFNLKNALRLFKWYFFPLLHKASPLKQV
jgi:hypothetical protein